MLLKCSVTVHCKPELMVGDAVIEIVSLIIIGMIRYRKNRDQVVVFYHQQQDTCNYNE